MLKDGYSLLLPEGLLDYFSILKVEEQQTQVRIYLEEKNNLDNPLYESKGFYANSLINDFPVRGKSLLWIFVVVDGSIKRQENTLTETFIL